MSIGAQTNQRLAALTAAGTSPWLDQIRRSLIESGELDRLLHEDSLRGVTSNPAIFEKAILGSSDYDDQIAELAAQGVLAHEPVDLAALDQAAPDLVEPGARAGGRERREPLVDLRPDAHARAPSRSSTARARAATFSPVKPKCS